MGKSSPHVLTVFAAASLIETFRELGQQFEVQHPGVEVRFNFAGSQQLLGQLQHGADADLFAPADSQEMAAAIDAGLVLSGTQQTFAYNRMTVIVPRHNPAGLQDLADLARPGVKIDIADRSVPAGRYALQLLTTMSNDPAFGEDFKRRVLANVVSREENVRAVVSKVRLGEVDAGIVYRTDVVGDAREELGALSVPDHLSPIATYQIAPLASTVEPELAQQFIAFALSPRGQQVVGKYEFITVQKDRP